MLMLYFLLRLADSCTVCVHGWMLSLLLDKYLALDYFVWFEMDYEKKSKREVWSSVMLKYLQELIGRQPHILCRGWKIAVHLYMSREWESWMRSHFTVLLRENFLTLKQLRKQLNCVPCGKITLGIQAGIHTGSSLMEKMPRYVWFDSQVEMYLISVIPAQHLLKATWRAAYLLECWFTDWLWVGYGLFPYLSYWLLQLNLWFTHI